MTDYGETATGFRGKTYDEALSELKARFRARISEELTLDEYDWLGNVVAICADREQLVWEALEVARNQFDPDNAEGNLAIGLAALTGTRRKDATKGTVTCSLTLDASKTFAPGALVAHVDGQPDNRWVNRDTVTSTSAGAWRWRASWRRKRRNFSRATGSSPAQGSSRMSSSGRAISARAMSTRCRSPWER